MTVAEHNHQKSIKADERTRQYRRLREEGLSRTAALKKMGVSPGSYGMTGRTLPEDRTPPRPALTRGQICYTLGYPAYSL